MKELETVVQDEKNKWILITGILQVLACVIMNKFDISNPNIILFVILSAVLLGETDSLSVMPVAALVLVCMEIYIVNRPEKTE